jgi:O-antigen/teichoic acid export membrane protein
LTKQANRARAGLLGWISWAGADAGGRLVLLSGSTIALSRLASPRDFGVAALVLTIVAVVAVFVGAPFEEALTQLPRIRSRHLSAALAASWAIGAVLFALTCLAALPLARVYDAPEIRLLLPVAMSSIFFSGHSDVIASLARRRRRFNELAYATLAGHIVGVVLSLAIAAFGHALWALVLQRVLIVVARAAILQWRIGFLVLPRWSSAPLRELARYASFSFLARLTDSLTYLAFNNLVQGLYGVAELGQVNMAMRLIEPIRSAVTATGHNLAFSFFARAAGDPQRLRQLRDHVISNSAFAVAPVFVGLAAVAPVLLPVVAGKGWDEAAIVAVCLSLAGAVAAPSGLIFTAYSANGRPDLSFFSLVASFAATVAALVGAAGLGPASVGLSRLVGDGVRTAIAIGVAPHNAEWPWRARLNLLLPAWRLATIMGLSVATLHTLLPGGPSLGRLALLIGVGVFSYAWLIALFARPAFDLFVGPVLRRGLALRRQVSA